ncbi:amino acid adenylation domain-containing protein [Kitasatospora cineracea]|uniref:Amino acid adenylation domain-containing protein n=1 Tax=Kitasatospora cineracea TaxID=88074 RepID=A0A8G1UEN2_9ACTN|nr:amino acid adenylation domain-containing protein [Kitasatospora cineracea]ROR42568.1 amino acid adenylation domain-containing protein [Kitasatospora cineracea]
MTTAPAAADTHRLTAALGRHDPSRPALAGPDGTLAYGELHAGARAVAAGLRERGLRPGTRVAVHGEKSTATVTAMLGVLLAGGAYVPLDPSAPEERRRALLTDSGSPWLLARRPRLDALAAQRLPVPVLAVEDLLAVPAPDGWRAADPAPADPAYVLYTSGSTGRPKGVQIHHGALEAFFAAVDPVLEIGPDAVCLNTTALHFDGSVADLLLPLLRGALVHLSPSVLLPAAVLGTVVRERVTHLTAVGSTLTLLAQHGTGLAGRDLGALRRILTGAEVLNPATVQSWLHAAPNLVVVNGYGPTETTCGIAFEPISAREPGRTEPYPIGPPLPGVGIAFLTEDGGLDPDGPGEILVSGPQVMTGYLDRPEEEAAAFLHRDGVRHYRTGDLGARRADGVLLFRGRRDDEVKIRGYRINLNEVRRVLETHPAVGRAFVAAVPDPREGLALACAVLAPDTGAGPAPELSEPAEAEAAALVAHTAAALPRYMVPRHWRRLSAFPALSNGKPDLRQVRALLHAAVAR